jgi:DNA-binding CsgD family transcriptional regulator
MSSPGSAWPSYRRRARRVRAPPGGATDTLAGLTPAEQAVAGLVAAGRSNRQTAAELYVSVKTVEFHLGHVFEHVFDKLGIRSRRDLITLASCLDGSPGRRRGCTAAE